MSRTWSFAHILHLLSLIEIVHSFACCGTWLIEWHSAVHGYMIIHFFLVEIILGAILLHVLEVIMIVASMDTVESAVVIEAGKCVRVYH